MKKTILAVCASVAAMLMPMASCMGQSSQEIGNVSFESEGIMYQSREGKAGEVEVVANSANPYTGLVWIPKEVVYEEKTYQVTAIGDGAFAGTTVIRVTMHDGIERIGDSAFRNCPSLIATRQIENMIESSVTMTEDGIRCRYVTLPKALTEIGAYAYSGTPQFLDKIEILENVRSIGDYAFSGCGKPESICCMAATPPTYGINAFDEQVLESATLYVGQAYMEAYAEAPGWNGFANRGTDDDFENKLHGGGIGPSPEM